MRPQYDFSSAERGKFRVATSFTLPVASAETTWEGPDGTLGRFVKEETCKTLDAYRAQPNHVKQDANHEYDTARGGYAHRQLYELVQNAADALIHRGTGGSILIRLTDRFLYCADDGAPIDTDGVSALMFAHLSPKRGTNEIGRFGLGFKSVLGVTDTPEFYSRSGAIRFDRKRAAERIGRYVAAERYPALRLPEAMDPEHEAGCDEDLRELMVWANNIVRLPLKGSAFDDLAAQAREFPPEFLLFVPHVQYLTLETGSESREFTLVRDGEDFRLNTGNGSSRWRRWEMKHALSDTARDDSRTLDDTGTVPIVWAAPLDRLTDPGRFWAFFPTQTASLLAGILNAPWKTNEDRQNLLPGPYNDELIDAAARMVAGALSSLATASDPARHLDALPRRWATGDGDHSKRLRDSLISALGGRAILPDQDGRLRVIDEISYAPEELTTPRVIQEPLNQWRSYERRPRDWVHHTALPRNRLAKIDQLLDRHGRVYRASVADWLAALKSGWLSDRSIEASKAAIRVAALLPESNRRSPRALGGIVLTQSEEWRAPDPSAVFLPLSDDDSGSHLVHVELASDEQVARDLRTLGLRRISTRAAFKSMADELPPRGSASVDDRWWQDFWKRARSAGVDEAASTLPGKEDRLRVYTVARKWQPADSVLLPGEIVPDDGSRDASAAVNVEYHGADIELLRRVGVSDRPTEKDLSSEPWFERFHAESERIYRQRDLPSSPQSGYLVFRSASGTGPLQVLTCLSDEGNARYVDALLNAEGSYQRWLMGHDTRSETYPDVWFSSPVLMMVEKHGRIRCGGGFAKFGDAIGVKPRNRAALQALRSHPMADRIDAAFTLAEPRFEVIGEEDPVPLRDVWPGAHASWRAYDLVRCQRIVGDDGSEPRCVRVDSNVLLVGTGNDAGDIRRVAGAMETEIDDGEIEKILHFVTQEEIKRRREEIRKEPTDAARLLNAVGEDDLLLSLPRSLRSAIKAEGASLTGVKVAEAAIATFHTGALYEHRRALTDLRPPTRWAGSPRAVEFVESLGFGPEWAGERRVRRAPFVEVDGPFSLPRLHAYQQRIVDRITDLLSKGENGGPRRGMISLPTGAGKTRVTVQAIVQAMRDGFYIRGVLWVADRDELCEQAVESWRQVWSGMGAATVLRISRMWDQQPAPVATSELHVVVATIQTLHTRLSQRDSAYRFIGDLGLVVFDEAHRSISRSYTSVMEEIGLTRWRRQDEPFLLGLTATPYRGHDESETARLVSRYGSSRLDNGAFSNDDPVAVVRELQAMRVLAQADHETIDGGKYSLNPAEVDEIESMPQPAWLPRSVEKRIADDTERTLGIVAAYQSQVAEQNPEWPTLIFATSVEHSHTVAGLLNMKGVKARAVSGHTDRSVRRSVVDGFRNGKITVLVNYGVFREGFDAPKTRAIVVARPVYSPNLYFQMIGRGLRGPKNGGGERCLIINVQDNIDNFERKLAFADLDWLWADAG